MQTLSVRQNAINIFHQFGGTLRTSKLLKLGVHPRTLYQMRENGEVIELNRGVYRLAELSELENSNLVTVTKRVPTGVICLVSALSFYGMTTEIPHEVYVAIPRGKEKPRVDYPPTRIFHFSPQTISAGVEQQESEGNLIKIFSLEKTVADCFKFRNKIGLDVAIEALKMCLAKNRSRRKILELARICRVEKVIRPYMEAIQ